MGCECPWFIKKYLPEFTYETTAKVFIIKVVLMSIIAGLLLLFQREFDERIFDTGSKITFTTIGIVLLFNLTVGFLIVIYVPYQWHVVPFWYSLLITVLYWGSTIYLTIDSLIFDNIAGVDDPAFDAWTIVHTLAGVWFGFIMPFLPMCYVVSVWEVLEAEWTEGLGDGESLSNHIWDVVVAVIGWLFTVILGVYVFPRLCPQSTTNCIGHGTTCFSKYDEDTNACLIPWVQRFYRIPWISSRAASCKKCHLNTDWSKTNDQDKGDDDNYGPSTEMV